MEELSVFETQEELVSVFSAQHGDRRGGGAKDFGRLPHGHDGACGARDCGRVIFDVHRLFAFEFKEDHGGEWRIGEGAPYFEFLMCESAVIAFGDTFDGGVFWGEGLQDDEAGAVAASGAPAHLCEQLVCPFGGAEIRQMQPHIGIDDTHERDVMDIVSFGDHLRTDEEIDVTVSEIFQDILDGLRCCPVAVESVDARVWEDCLEQGDEAFGAVSGVTEFVPSAFGANCLAWRFVVTVVASQFIGVFVVGEGDVAVWAIEDVAAEEALNEGGEAAPVEKDHGLFVFLERVFQGIFELRRDQARFEGEDITGDGGRVRTGRVLIGGRVCRCARLRYLRAHIDDGDFGHGACLWPSCEHQEGRFILERARIGFEGWGSGAEDDGALGVLSEDEGHVARVVAWRFALFKGRVMFFVDDDEAQVLDGGEECATRSDDDAQSSVSDSRPGIEPFFFAQGAMEDGDVVSEASPEDGAELGCQRDFGKDEDASFIFFARIFDGLEIDLGFAASGNAEEQESSESLVGVNGVDGLPLFFGWRDIVDDGADIVEGGFIAGGGMRFKQVCGGEAVERVVAWAEFLENFVVGDGGCFLGDPL